MQLLETIKCLDGVLHNLEFHQSRFDQARRDHFLISESINLGDSIKVPENKLLGLFRCRVLYSQKIERIEFLSHQIKNITSLKLIVHDAIDYSYKFSNRKSLDEIYRQREDCDDILIVKNGCITDSYTANPIFFDGISWWAPETTLLAGTQRARLISEGKVKVCRIAVEDLCKYRKVGLINALQDMEDMPKIDISCIS